MNNSINVLIDKQELQIVADLRSALSKTRSEGSRSDEVFEKDVGTTTVQLHCASEEKSFTTKFVSNTELQGSDASTNSSSDWDYGSSVLEDFTAGTEPGLAVSERSTGREGPLDETTLDGVEVLELENGSDEDDSWLYVSPRKSSTDGKESALKWCRQVLDHPSPETEAACRTLLSRLDQGYLSLHSALSSQSSVDSELSTSDDSISLGYKLQDLTDVQVMARLQEESLRQDCASSSASVSRRSSSASLHSLRRGTYSDQDFDTYSLEDEDDDCSFSYHSSHRYSPSPLSSPRCQSPSTNTDYGRASGTRIRPPRRTMQSPVQDRLKYSGNEEPELQHSMPNLARTGLRSFESVRNSRSLESDLQVPGSRLSRIQQPSSSKLASSVNAVMMLDGCNAFYIGLPLALIRNFSYSVGSSSSGARSSTVATAAKNSLPKSKTSVGGTSSLKSKLTHPVKR
uniref:SLAIN motif-containing protein-like n=1 Tax=Varanus komodoensis TaxID=61221 RepID=A0A8D2LEG4_VARKO